MKTLEIELEENMVNVLQKIASKEKMTTENYIRKIIYNYMREFSINQLKIQGGY
jgi:predicted DNA-binding ribbon-helix-helix protein